MCRLDCCCSLVHCLILYEGIVALDLDTPQAPKFLKQLLQVALAGAHRVKVHNKEGGGGQLIAAASILSALDITITLDTRQKAAMPQDT